MRSKSGRFIAAGMASLVLILAALGSALGQGLPCQADLEYFGLLPGTVKVYQGDCSVMDFDSSRETQYHSTLTQTVKAVTADGDACRVEIEESEDNKGAPADARGPSRGKVFVYIYQGKVYGPLGSLSVSDRPGQNPDRSQFGQASDWGTYFLGRDLKPQTQWQSSRQEEYCEEKDSCTAGESETVSTPAGNYSHCQTAGCTVCIMDIYYSWAFKEKVGLVKLEQGGEGGGCKYTLNSSKSGTPPSPPPETKNPPRPPITQCPSLMNETVGGLKIGDDLSKVTAARGKPEKTSAPQYQEMTDEYLWDVSFPSQGIEFGISGDKSGSKGRVYRIHTYEGSTAFTGSGIGIGSSIADIESAYGKGSLEGSNYHFTIYDPPDEECCGRTLSFKVVKGVVVGIEFFDFEQ